MRLLTCLVATAALLGPSVRADVPNPRPLSADRLRASAEEAVTIQVTGTVQGADGTIGLHAKVLGVERSKAGLKKGDTIWIMDKKGEETKGGPVPDQDEVAPAFLNKKGDQFVPAAGARSFQMTPEAKG